MFWILLIIVLGAGCFVFSPVRNHSFYVYVWFPVVVNCSIDACVVLFLAIRAWSIEPHGGPGAESSTYAAVFLRFVAGLLALATVMVSFLAPPEQKSPRRRLAGASLIAVGAMAMTVYCLREPLMFFYDLR